MHKGLIVGFDGSPPSRSALHWAAAQAQLTGCPVHVLAAYSWPPIGGYYGSAAALVSAAELQTMHDDCNLRLRAGIADVLTRFPGVGVDSELVNGAAAAALIRCSEKADLVVIGGSGAGAVRKFILGSVAASVLHESLCPVAIIPATLPGHVGRVVVGVDGSTHADAAVKWASAECDRRGSDLVVLHAWQYPYRFADTSFEQGNDIARVEAAKILESATRLAREFSNCVVQAQLIEAGTVQCLLEAAADADLVVVGSRGRGGFRTMLFGSVTHALSAHTETPLVVVRSSSD